MTMIHTRLKIIWVCNELNYLFIGFVHFYLTEKLVDVWQEVGLPLNAPATASCTFCDRPLYFDLMSEWEKSYFGNMEPRYITVAAQ